MNDVLVRQDSHRRSHTDTVIGTEGRTVSRHPLAVILYISLDSIFLEIKHLVAVLLRYHIHVSLQDHTRMVLIARRSRFTDQHVADLVLKGLQTETLAIIH